jgi:hypothetical protein
MQDFTGRNWGTPHMSAGLFEEHQHLIAAAERIMSAIERKPRVRIDELSRMRAQLSTLVMAHRIAEEQQILGPFYQGGCIDLLPQVKPLMTEIRDMWMDYSDHIRRWTPKAIQDDWDGYCRATSERIRIMKRMIVREEQEIYHPVLDLLKTSQSENVFWSTGL